MADTTTNEYGVPQSLQVANLIAVTPAATPLAKADGTPGGTFYPYVANDGDITVTTKGGQTITITNVVGGSWVPVQVTHITAAPADTLAGY